MSETRWPSAEEQARIERDADPSIGDPGSLRRQGAALCAGWSPGSPGLVVVNAVAYAGWLRRGHNRQVPAFVLACERRWPGVGAEAGASALERVYERTAAAPDRFRFPRSPGAPGAPGVHALHRMQARFLVRTAWRGHARQLRLLSPYATHLEATMRDNAAGSHRPGPRGVSAELRLAELWFRADWEGALPHPMWIFLATFFGAPVTEAIHRLGGSASNRSNWRDEAARQVAWRSALLSGLGPALDDLVEQAPLLTSAPPHPPAAEALPGVVTAAGALGDRVRSLALPSVAQLPGLALGERDGLQALLEPGARGRARVDTQLRRMQGATPAERHRRLLDLFHELGRRLAGDGDGGGRPRDLPLTPEAWTGASFRALRAGFEDPIARRRWIADAEALERGETLVEAVRVRAEEGWRDQIARIAASARLPRVAVLAVVAALVVGVWTHAPPTPTILPTQLVQPDGAVEVYVPGQPPVDLPLGTTPSTLRETLPPGTALVLRLDQVTLLDDTTTGATLIVGPPTRVERLPGGRVPEDGLRIPLGNEAPTLLLLAPGELTDDTAADILRGATPAPPGSVTYTLDLRVSR